jgi:hypothetical protein
MSGATSGDWKRSYATRIEAPARPVTATPRSAATAPVVDSTVVGDAYLSPIALSVDVRLCIGGSTAPTAKGRRSE